MTQSGNSRLLITRNGIFVDVGKFIKKLDHPGLVPDDERVDDVHVRLLGAKLDQIRQILKAFGHQSQRPIRRFGRSLSDQIKRFRVSVERE